MISLDPTKQESWRARPLKDRRRVLTATSAAALGELLRTRPAQASLRVVRLLIDGERPS